MSKRTHITGDVGQDLSWQFAASDPRRSPGQVLAYENSPGQVLAYENSPGQVLAYENYEN